jgi:hypothetical protein
VSILPVLEVLEQGVAVPRGSRRGKNHRYVPDVKVSVAGRVVFDCPQKRAQNEQGRVAICMSSRKGKSTRDKDKNARRGGDAPLRRLRSDQMAGM